ncbi:MAG: hypothetical protein HY235_02095 [Acidobacteria bacterium]|nr:hypothetical protein [Acidobacteriota bacterium]
MPLEARTWVRKMRGGSQAHLLVAEDGHHYVVKCRQNPQHRRILVNEWVSSALLEYLEIPTPRAEMIHLSEEFLREHPELSIQFGQRLEPVAPGWHFGSRLPVDPNRVALYDYLPDALLRQVANLGDFLGALVFDKWVNNTDSRQSVFFRAQVREWSEAARHSRRQAFVSLMIDHGYVFGGPYWQLDGSPLTGLYFRPLVYETVTGLASFEPWLERVVHCPMEPLDKAFRRVPESWLDGDRDEFERVLERLWKRRPRVPGLIEETRNARGNPFPQWR